MFSRVLRVSEGTCALALLKPDWISGDVLQPADPRCCFASLILESFRIWSGHGKTLLGRQSSVLPRPAQHPRPPPQPFAEIPIAKMPHAASPINYSASIEAITGPVRAPRSTRYPAQKSRSPETPHAQQCRLADAVIGLACFPRDRDSK